MNDRQEQIAKVTDKVIKDHRMELKEKWSSEARKVLVGKTIKRVMYSSDSDRDEMMWHDCPLIIELDDGTLIYPMSDDEGNNAGAISVIDNNNRQHVLPVI